MVRISLSLSSLGNSCSSGSIQTSSYQCNGFYCLKRPARSCFLRRYDDWLMRVLVAEGCNAHAFLTIKMRSRLQEANRFRLDIPGLKTSAPRIIVFLRKSESARLTSAHHSDRSVTPGDSLRPCARASVFISWLRLRRSALAGMVRAAWPSLLMTASKFLSAHPLGSLTPECDLLTPISLSNSCSGFGGNSQPYNRLQVHFCFRDNADHAMEHGRSYSIPAITGKFPFIRSHPAR